MNYFNSKLSEVLREIEQNKPPINEEQTLWDLLKEIPGGWLGVTGLGILFGLSILETKINERMGH